MIPGIFRFPPDFFSTLLLPLTFEQMTRQMGGAYFAKWTLFFLARGRRPRSACAALTWGRKDIVPTTIVVKIVNPIASSQMWGVWHRLRGRPLAVRCALGACMGGIVLVPLFSENTLAHPFMNF